MYAHTRAHARTHAHTYTRISSDSTQASECRTSDFSFWWGHATVCWLGLDLNSFQPCYFANSRTLLSTLSMNILYLFIFERLFIYYPCLTRINIRSTEGWKEWKKKIEMMEFKPCFFPPCLIEVSSHWGMKLVIKRFIRRKRTEKAVRM